MSKVFFPRRYPSVPLKNLVGIVNSCDFAKQGLPANYLKQSSALNEIGCIFLNEKDAKKRMDLETFLRTILNNVYYPSSIHFVVLRILKHAGPTLSERTPKSILRYESNPANSQTVEAVGRWL